MRALAMLSATLCLVALWTAAWPFTVDDAYIAARYAARLARGLGYTFNAGPPTDGVTGPLWLLPLTLAAWLGLDLPWVAKLTGCLASALSLAAVLRRVGARAQGRIATWIALAVGCTSAPFVVWSVAGLETGLATLCVTSLVLSVSARPVPRTYLAGLAFAALAWLRPELLGLGCVLLLALVPHGRRAWLRAGCVAATGVLLLLALRLALFGQVLPLSVAAKPAMLGNGVTYVGAALLRARAQLVLLVIGLSVTKLSREQRVLCAALGVQLIALMLAGGDWMPGFRLLAPLTPVIALLLAGLLARLALRRRGLVVLLGGLLITSSSLELATTLSEVRAAGERQRARAPQLARAVCAARGSVALVDVGAPGLACVTQPLIDLGGLTEPRIAHAPGGHLDKQLDGAWLATRAPALIVLHSREPPKVDAEGYLRWFAGYPVERRVLALPWVRAGYRVQHVLEYAPDYHYVLLTPR